MSGFPAAQIWYREDSDVRPNPNPVHAVIEGTSEALCKEAHIVYYRSETFTVPPPDGVVHEACQEAVDKLNKQ